MQPPEYAQVMAIRCSLPATCFKQIH